MFAQFPQAHTEVVTSLSFSPHNPNILCSTSGDDSAALWDIQNGGTNIARLQGHHRGPVNHALFLPNDPNTLMTASDDRTIAFWDLRRPERPVAQLTGFHDGVNKMLLLSANAFPNCGLPVSGASESYLLASACDDGRVYVHAIVPMLLPTTGESADSPQATTSPASPFGAAGASQAASGFGQGANSGQPALPAAGTLVDCFWASTSTVNDIIPCPGNPQMVITASEDGSLRTWRLLFDVNASTEDRLLCSLDEFENPVNHVAMVPQGLMSLEEASAEGGATPAATQAATAVGQETDRGADAQHDIDGAEEEAAAGAAGPIGTAGAPGHTTATTMTTTTTTYGDDEAGHEGVTAEQTAQLRREHVDEERRGLRRWVLAACSEFVFATDLQVVSGEFGQGARSFVGHTDYVRGLEFTKAGTLLTVSDDSTAMEWSLQSCEPIRQVKLHEGYVMASAQSAAGDVLATGTDRGEIRVWRLPFQTECLGGASS